MIIFSLFYLLNCDLSSPCLHFNQDTSRYVNRISPLVQWCNFFYSSHFIQVRVLILCPFQDLFDNLEKWQDKHTVLNESGNFLIEVVEEPIANEIKQQLLLINRRWKDVSDQAKQFLSVSILSPQSILNVTCSIYMYLHIGLIYSEFMPLFLVSCDTEPEL